MAPKTHYDAGEVQQEVNEATAHVFENLKAEGWEFSESTELTCEYLGPLTDDGYTLTKKPTLRSTIGLKWSYRDHCTVASLIKNVRYDYYLGHGITFPEHWKTAFKCDFLTRISQEAAVTFAEESLFEDVSCRFVGAPRPAETLRAVRVCGACCRSTLSELRNAQKAIP